MPQLKGLRKRGHSYYYCVREGSTEKQIPLGRNLDLAVTKVLEFRRRIDAGKPITDDRPTLTVADAARQWLDEYVQHNRWERFCRETESRVKSIPCAVHGQGED